MVTDGKGVNVLTTILVPAMSLSKSVSAHMSGKYVFLGFLAEKMTLKRHFLNRNKSSTKQL